MIEVTCGACGSASRFSEADVPPGGKTVTCAKCKARIQVPPPRISGAMPAIPAPSSSGGTGDVINLSDLPAPKRPSPLAGAKLPPLTPPIPKPKLPSLPKPPAKPAASGPPPVTVDMDAVDLPAPVGPTPTGGLDLPAPKRASGAPADRFADLPAPKRPSGGMDEISIDLPAPVGPTPTGGLDLPAPKRASTPSTPPLDPFADLPAPKSAAPSGAIDLPAPKGFFDDLPAPAADKSADLPAPKGPVPSSAIDLPAPKGFFDDLPAPAAEKAADLPAPKGFFDDLPGPRTAPASVPPPASGPASRGKGLDLDDLDLAPPTQPPTRVTPPPAATAMPVPPGAMPLELDDATEVPALELDAPAGDRFGGLDLPAADVGPSARPAEPAGVVSFKPSAAAPAVISSPRPDPASLDLDLDDTRQPKPTPSRTSAEIAGARPTGREGKAAAGPRPRRNLRTILLVAALAAVGVGAGGFYLYRGYQARQEAAEKRDAHLADARRLLASEKANHWSAAADAAENVLASDPRHGEALTLAAQAYLAGYLDEGTQKKQRLTRAEALVEDIRIAGLTGPAADKALGLFAIVKRDAEGAVKRLGAVAEKNPKDVDAQLFHGWALAAARDWKGAIAAYEKAADSKTRAVPATYGIGVASLAIGDLEGARRSFSLVNELVKQGDHIGAQIGIAAAMPASDYARRETELLAVLGRKDIAKADPRVVAYGWTIAGDDARRAGRLDAARDRYRKALELDEGRVAAMVGDAEVAIAEGRLEAAAATLESAAKLDEKNAGVNLALADLALREGQLELAGTRLAAATEAAAHPLDRARAHLLEGRRREAAGDGAGALESYRAAQDALGPSDIGPTIAQATLLGKMAASAGDSATAKKHRDAATELLGALESKAKSDPATALALGRAYLAAGEGNRAEEWLRVAKRARPDDVEINFQLAEALEQQGKSDAAVELLRQAFELDPARVDVGLELALTYEQAGRRDDAAAMYGRLLASPAVTLDMRMRAGLFYARTGDAAAAATQGEAIAKEEPNHPAGMYLRGEGLLAEGKHDEARRLFKGAAAQDPQAIYHDGLGRAAEAQWRTSDDSQFRDEALVAYSEAATVDPRMLSAQMGKARLHRERNEWDKAIEAYTAARAIDPGQAEIALGLGLAYAGKRENAKAIEWLSTAVKLTPTAEAHFLLGKLYLNELDERRAASHYASATRLALEDERAGKGTVPWLTDAYWQLGQLLERTSERAACDAYDKYLSRNPTDAIKVREVKSKRLAFRC